MLVPPTQKPTIRVPPTQKPTLRVPPTSMPLLRVPPTQSPLLRIPPTEAPGFRIPPTESPVTTIRVPPTAAIRVPPTATIRVPPTTTAIRVPPTADIGNIRVPPTVDIGNIRVPPTADMGNIRVPPTAGIGNIRVPPTADMGNIRVPPTANNIGENIPSLRVPPTAATIPDGADDSPIIIISPNMGAAYSGPISEKDIGCGFTSAEMKNQGFIDVISTVTAQSSLSDTNSPQSKAAAWMSANTGICPSDANVLQRYVLGVLYFATNGESWIDPLGFLSSANECNWTGIECDSSNKVTSIAIAGNNLSGAIPNEIGSLDNLSSISLTQGDLTGPIPDSLYNLPLTELELSDNNLNGDVSVRLYELTDLEKLHLDNNQFRGSIESDISNLSNLVSLKLNDNQFKSRMKRELKDLQNLEVAQFHNNGFYGKVPTRMCNLFLPRFNGKLRILTSDCASLDPVLGTPLVSCECCTQCY